MRGDDPPEEEITVQTIRILCIGKLKERYWAEACGEYEKRLGGLCRLTVVELPEERLPEAASQRQIAAALEKEGKRLLDKAEGFHLVSLCVEGKKLDSVAFAQSVLCDTAGLRSQMAFAIGSSYGLSEEVKRASALRLSFSEMTFPHQLMRVVLLEQLYRAHKILGGGTYHK